MSIDPQFIQPDSAFPPDLNITLSTFPMDNTCGYFFDPMAAFMPVLTDHRPIVASPYPLNLGNAAPSLELNHCAFGASAGVSTPFTSGDEPAALRLFRPRLSRPLDPIRCNPSHVPRPRNAYKIYSTLFDALAPYQRTTNYHQRKKNKGQILNPRSTSRQAAACWRALSQMDREVFKDLARTEKELDRMKHRRNYHHTSNFRRPTKVTKPRKSSEELSQFQEHRT